MAGVLEKLAEDIKSAMKAGDSVRLSTLRMLKSAAKNKEIDLGKPLGDAEFIALVSTMVKQRQESVDQYTKAGQPDRAKSEQAEIALLQVFLPQALTEAEVVQIIADAVKKVGATSAKDMGNVMKELKEKTAGRVDGKILADKVRAALNQ